MPAGRTTEGARPPGRRGQDQGEVASERIELARYTVRVGERVLYGQRISGVVRVTDVPASGRGRACGVERELEQDSFDALKALVADFVEQSQMLAEVPIAVSPLN